jgi:hypothetical protein
MIRSRRISSSSLPNAEPVSAENVVYAMIVQQDEEDDIMQQQQQVNNWELVALLFLVSFMILVAGIAIGRFTAPSPAHILSSSCKIPNMTTCGI